MRAKIRDPKRRKWEARRRRVLRRMAHGERHRLTVFRSGRHIYAQLEDPVSGLTITGVSTRSPQLRGQLQGTGNVEAAKLVGRSIADLARSRGIQRVVFNRNGFLYHGRVRAVAEAAREAGLEF